MNPLYFVFFFALFLGSILFLGYVPNQSDFFHIIAPYAIAFLLYVYAIRNKRFTSFSNLIFLGITVRFALIFTFPNLSDDIYRFLWDGYLQLDGRSPYTSLPSKLIQTTEQIPGITTDLFERLNSPDYFTIYPSISQLVYVAASNASRDNWYVCSIVIKSTLFLSEIINIVLIIKILGKLKMDLWKAIIYLLNPLVIIEIMGNVHFEGLMLSGLLIFYFLALQNKYIGSAIALGSAIATKLIPLLYIPFILLSRRKFSFYLILSAVLMVLFLPILIAIPHFGSSLNLYFQKFEFNAGIYYLLRAIGFQASGYNLIAYLGPLLAVSTAVIIIIHHIRHRRDISWQAAPNFFVIAHLVFLAMATTVHPWYLIIPLAWCVFTSFKFPIIWSGLIMLSYINYSYTPYWENMWIVTIQYIIVICCVCWDWSKGHFNIPAGPNITI